MKKTFYLKKLNIVLATRDFANFAVESAKDQKSNEISFREIESVSRSFLDELYILCQKNRINIIEVPENLTPLYDVIKKSHQDQVLYAPKIRVNVSDKTFA
ncbi:MAG: hypothetical protein ABSE91_03495 [Patescibacteria group bacterium]|jgi:hypothetical protein